MENFLALSQEDRRRACLETEEKLHLRAPGIEKDFWVCWILRELFRLPEWGAHLTFKGGTSLSKAWGLIERFSEDIDLVIDREHLGFGGDQSPEQAPSKNQRQKRLETLKITCQQRIRDSLSPALVASLGTQLSPAMAWTLGSDPGDPDGQTLLFSYPTVFGEAAGYIRPVVKIELGARSDTEPSQTAEIHPYLADAFPQILGPSAFSVKVVVPERTFWEKVMLLHEEYFRPAGKPRKARLARHYYDLWCLITQGVADRAAADRELFDRIAAHRVLFFPQNWMKDYDTLRLGSIRLVPPEDQMAQWRRDYQAMSEMFFGEAPGFEEAVRVVREFEERVNHM